jgi:hypothetical protein
MVEINQRLISTMMRPPMHTTVIFSINPQVNQGVPRSN